MVDNDEILWLNEKNIEKLDHKNLQVNTAKYFSNHRKHMNKYINHKKHLTEFL